MTLHYVIQNDGPRDPVLLPLIANSIGRSIHLQVSDNYILGAINAFNYTFARHTSVTRNVKHRGMDVWASDLVDLSCSFIEKSKWQVNL